MTAQDLIRANTVLTPPPLVPEIRLHLATELVPLWRRTEEELAGMAPPYWAFAWAGGQALARHVLDNPALVRGKRVLDIGAGSGLVALAAAKAGAAAAEAADIDPNACAAIALNAQANSLAVAITCGDLIGGAGEWDIVLVGDLFYERPLAQRLLSWLAGLTAPVLLGDPGRSYFPLKGVEQLAMYKVQTPFELEDRDSRDTGVYRLVA